jgi:hypothetical protein
MDGAAQRDDVGEFGLAGGGPVGGDGVHVSILVGHKITLVPSEVEGRWH